MSPEQKGRLSNPVQRRLSEAEIQDLIRRYDKGESIDALARDCEVHRTTVMGHLKRAGVERRRQVRKMTDNAVAGRQHGTGTAHRSPSWPTNSLCTPGHSPGSSTERACLFGPDEVARAGRAAGQRRRVAQRRPACGHSVYRV